MELKKKMKKKKGKKGTQKVKRPSRFGYSGCCIPAKHFFFELETHLT